MKIWADILGDPSGQVGVGVGMSNVRIQAIDSQTTLLSKCPTCGRVVTRVWNYAPSGPAPWPPTTIDFGHRHITLDGSNYPHEWTETVQLSLSVVDPNPDEPNGDKYGGPGESMLSRFQAGQIWEARGQRYTVISPPEARDDQPMVTFHHSELGEMSFLPYDIDSSWSLVEET